MRLSPRKNSLTSEIGDRTFLIAAILSMHHPRMTIFAAALSALGVMSFLSALLGNILPGLLPKQYTTAAAAILFFVFGAKMLREGLEMEGGEAGREKMEEEMREVQKEVQEGRSMLRGSPSDGEEGLPTPVVSGSNSGRGGRKAKDALNSVSEGVKNLAQLLFSPIFIQAFVLTFLAEWGDRSQITTIALGAAHNVWIVTMGTTLGHSICTGGAVLGGRWISQHISIKHVTLGGAVLFLIFGVMYSYEAIYFIDEAPLA
ncbi:UPF0016-domain-containing protein [Rhodotorula sp. JG-1b]|nr:UPF0016-domain-containing protein [Rhodotorula sp. JG-1b]